MTTSSGFMKVLGATWQIVLPLIRRAKPRNNRVFPTFQSYVERHDRTRRAAGSGAPYHRQASLSGVGSDCLGLIRGIWHELYGPELMRCRIWPRGD